MQRGVGIARDSTAEVEALACGSHCSCDPVVPLGLHLFATSDPSWVGTDALISELYALARAADNPYRFGGPQYDSLVYGLRITAGRALARRYGADRPTQLSFDRLVGIIFYKDCTGHMRVVQYRSALEFEVALERERELDKRAKNQHL